MTNLLQKFAEKPFGGQFLVVSEYRDGHGGRTAPVVDLINVQDDDIDQNDDPRKLAEDEIYLGVPADCASALYDSMVEFEVWPNGEVYLSGDGLDHPRYRVTAMHEFAPIVELNGSDDLTSMEGEPVWWCVDGFDQESYPDKPGIKVEMGIWHHLMTSRPGWEFRKAFGEEAEPLLKIAVAEFQKPKYGAMPRVVYVNGQRFHSWYADYMPAGHELKKEKAQ